VDPVALARATGGKRILITGASFGIGRAMAQQLGRCGAELWVAARSLDSLEDLVAEIEAGGGTARAIRLDLADPTSIDAFTTPVLTEGRGFDVIIHNAGKSIRRLVAESLKRPHDYRRTMAVNYLGPVQLQLGLLAPMIVARAGHIVHVSNVGVRLPAAPRWSAYLASDSAFDTWMRSARPELRAFGIACTTIYLGLVHTEMSAPTQSYRGLPGMTADEAAGVVCRALIRRPRTIEPWWVSLLRPFVPWCEGLVDWVFGRLIRRDARRCADPAQSADGSP